MGAKNIAVLLMTRLQHFVIVMITKKKIMPQRIHTLLYDHFTRRYIIIVNKYKYIDIVNGLTVVSHCSLIHCLIQNCLPYFYDVRIGQRRLNVLKKKN